MQILTYFRRLCTHLEGGKPLARLRKMVALGRFLARLGKKGPEGWIVSESDGTKNRDEGYQD